MNLDDKLSAARSQRRTNPSLNGQALAGGDNHFITNILKQNDVANVVNVATSDNPAQTEPLTRAKQTLEQMLTNCKVTPEWLLSQTFIEAVRTIRKYDTAYWDDYRSRLKKAKPSSLSIATIDQATTPITDADGHSTAAKLIQMVESTCSLFYDDLNDKPCAEVTVNGIPQTMVINSRSFYDWLSFAFYTKTKDDNGRGKSASELAIKQACFALSGIAKHGNIKQSTHLRIATHNGAHYVFLANDHLQAVEVMATGYRVVDQYPVKFLRPPTMQALPIPQPGGAIERLWEFVNVPQEYRLLVLAWMLESLRPDTPFPILALSGMQGCAKSSTQDKLRQLIDPNQANLRAAPQKIEDIFVSAGCNWLISFENLSKLSPQMQDALCVLATGGGSASRKLFTNGEEAVINVKRPVIINSIPSVITAQDLVDRVISVELPRIHYREESDINPQWETAKPAIFGALMTLFSNTLAKLPAVKLTHPPRMADFARLGEAMAQALGHDAGIFLALYKENRLENTRNAMESSPVTLAVCEMVEQHLGLSDTVYHGTVKTLLETLSRYGNNTKNWPATPRGLSDVLKRQSPALEALGITIELTGKIERTEAGRGKTLTIKRTGNIDNVSNVVLFQNASKKENDDVERF